jgi:predicted nuclease with TOPRIM domain
MSMNFLDETDDWPEYQTIREEIHRLEMEYNELNRELQAIQSISLSDVSAEEMAQKVESMKTKLKEVQRKLDASLSLYR